MPPPRSDVPMSVGYDIGRQDASRIYNSEWTNYIIERQSFLAEVAATKTKARILAWLGFVLFVAGSATYGAMIIRFVKTVSNAGPELSPTDAQLLGPDVAGVPIGAIGIGVAGLGVTLLIVGIVLHIVASSRRRRFERDTPLPFPPLQY
jgi:hypothetical protein